jgi:tetratricopeptide (TPR) repeat protein
MAYFDLGKYGEAEKWLNRARNVDKTKIASEYNLGRIAFELGRYEEALRYFDRILSRDPENVLALRAAAYTRIRLEDLAGAESLYNRVLALVPESADDGYNYALVLYAMERYEKTEELILKYQFALDDNKDILLLLARSQGAQDKVEAMDNYAAWLADNTDPKVSYEYAGILEGAEYYARALEEYRKLLTALPAEGIETPAGTVKKPFLRFTVARLLLIADSENEEGITEFEQALTDGFDDSETIEALLGDPKISDSRKDDIRRVIEEHAAAVEKAEAEARAAGPAALPEEISPEAGEAEKAVEEEEPPEDGA